MTLLALQNLTLYGGIKNCWRGRRLGKVGARYSKGWDGDSSGTSWAKSSANFSIMKDCDVLVCRRKINMRAFLVLFMKPG